MYSRVLDIGEGDEGLGDGQMHQRCGQRVTGEFSINARRCFGHRVTDGDIFPQSSGMIRREHVGEKRKHAFCACRFACRSARFELCSEI